MSHGHPDPPLSPSRASFQGSGGTWILADGSRNYHRQQNTLVLMVTGDGSDPYSSSDIDETEHKGPCVPHSSLSTAALSLAFGNSSRSSSQKY